MHFLRDFPLNSFNTFGVAALARQFAVVSSEQDLMRWCSAAGQATPPFLLGGGSNLLLTHEIEVPVLQLALLGKRVIFDEGNTVLVEAMAGERWHAFVQWTLAQGLSGLENLSLIPGFVGAAPVQNIGAYGVEMAATCDSVMAIDTATGEPREFRRADCQFSYRDSVFKRPPAGQHAADEDHRDRFAITRVRFRLSRRFVAHVDYGEVKAELQAMGVTAPTAMDVARAVVAIRSRKLPDPAVQGNAGSFFKNPVVPAAQAAALRERYPALPQYPADATGEQVKLAAGWLIEQAGWKGRGITTDSPAAVSERHALVLVNRGGATGAQLWGLAQAIQFDVADKFGVLLQPEPRIV